MNFLNLFSVLILAFHASSAPTSLIDALENLPAVADQTAQLLINPIGTECFSQGTYTRCNLQGFRNLALLEAPQLQKIVQLVQAKLKPQSPLAVSRLVERFGLNGRTMNASYEVEGIVPDTYMYYLTFGPGCTWRTSVSADIRTKPATVKDWRADASLRTQIQAGLILSKDKKCTVIPFQVAPKENLAEIPLDSPVIEAFDPRFTA